MKKKIVMGIIMSAIIALTGCTIKEDVNINFAESYTVNNDKITSMEGLQWESQNLEVAEVTNGTITGVGPGTTTILARNNDKIEAEYTVTVSVIPISNIILSTNTLEITVDEINKISYTLFPDGASDYGIQWKSANDSVATVSQNGEIVGKNVGQTTITASTSDGVVSACSVTVNQKPAYDRLTTDEKAFVDCALKHISSFYNVDSVVIKAIEKDGDDWRVELSAQNGFGGMRTNTYFLDEELGFWNWNDLDIDIDVSVTPSSRFDVSLINEALDEKK